MNPELQLQFQERLKEWRKPRTGLPLFAKDVLKIQNKEGNIVPFEFNDAQWFLHEKLEDQREALGLVRATGLKGRRQGFSTYIAARYYHRAVTTFGRKAYILSHEKKSSEALFTMTERFQRYNPFAPTVGEDNASKLTFPKLESTYTVATAGAQEGGRGDDVNLFHGSEVAYWQNAESHFAASLQCVALLPGTEIVFESTSGGPTGKFYEQFQKGLQDEEIYQSIFIPWYVSKDYFFPPAANFTLSTEAIDEQTASEADLAKVYNLSGGQMNWRRQKVNELGINRFNREYPTAVEDAWAETDASLLIKPVAVLRARGRTTEPSGPLILGVDPAGGGGDRFAIAFRRGNCVEKVIFRNKINIIEATEWVLSVILEYRPERVNIDSGNIGQALITNLRSRDAYCTQVVRSVSFGSPSQIKQANRTNVGPENRRAEMWGRLKDWLEDPDGHADIPNMDDLSSDLLAPTQIFRVNGDWILKSKADMKKEGKRSPDLGDAVALTFASKEILPSRPSGPTGLAGVSQVAPVAPAPQAYYTEDFSETDAGWMA